MHARFFGDRILTRILFMLLLATGFSAWGSAQAATTYYVRTDGGTPPQCTGRADAAYPGTGTAQACAWKSLHYALPAASVPRSGSVMSTASRSRSATVLSRPSRVCRSRLTSRGRSRCARNGDGRRNAAAATRARSCRPRPA